MKSILTTEQEFTPQLEFFTDPAEIIKGIHRQEWDSGGFRYGFAPELSLLPVSTTSF